MSDPEPAAPAGPAGPSPLRLGELRSDVPAALRLAVIVLVAGLPLGALWALLAPGVGTIMLAGGASGTVPGETDHAFDAVAVFVLLTVAFGVVAAGAAWRRRADRGPVMLVGVVLATLAGAWLASRVGVWLAPTPAPVPVLVDHAAISSSGAPGPPVPGSLGVASPSPGPWWSALVAGLAATMTYLIAAIVDGHEDPRHH